MGVFDLHLSQPPGETRDFALGLETVRSGAISANSACCTCQWNWSMIVAPYVGPWTSVLTDPTLDLQRESAVRSISKDRQHTKVQGFRKAVVSV